MSREMQVKVSAAQAERIKALQAAGLISTDATAFVRQCVDEGFERLAERAKVMSALDRYAELGAKPMKDALPGSWAPDTKRRDDRR